MIAECAFAGNALHRRLSRNEQGYDMALEFFYFLFPVSYSSYRAPFQMTGKRKSAESSVAGLAEGRYFAGKLGRFRHV